MGRYDRNGIFTNEEMKRIQSSHVCVIGSGGLGGYIQEMLVRVGIGEITCVDNDVFEESNLNRQLFSNMANLGKSKVAEAKKRLESINPNAVVHAVHEFVDHENVFSIIQDADIVMDALDNIRIRLVVEAACEEKNIPLVHGAIAGWYGQITTVLPGDGTLRRLYKDQAERGIEVELGNPSFTPATIASIQVSEALKVLVGREEIIRNKILMVDLLDNEYQIVTI